MYPSYTQNDSIHRIAGIHTFQHHLFPNSANPEDGQAETRKAKKNVKGE
jgi:hypothetical protein